MIDFPLRYERQGKKKRERKKKTRTKGMQAISGQREESTSERERRGNPDNRVERGESAVGNPPPKIRGTMRDYSKSQLLQRE